MTKFFSLPSPYSDFAVINFADTALAAKMAQRIKAAMNSQELLVQVTPANPACVAIHSKQARLFSRENRTYLFSGFGRIGNQFVFGSNNFSKIVNQRDISGDVGQFTFFVIDQDGVSADNDLLGHGHLFSSQHDGYAIIANRLHLQTILIRALGHVLDLNECSALSLLFSGHVFFAQQNMSNEMLCQGVHLVPIDRRASMSGGILDLQRKKSHEYSVTPAPADYEYLIEEGVREVIDNARAVLENEEFGSVVVDLSGGKDSRMVFGAALNVPGWQRRIALNSVDVPNSQDLPIACGIAHYFGARFYHGDSQPQTPISSAQNLIIWRSYFHGLYHRVGATAWSTEGRNFDSITLSGGSGEILRTFWHQNLRQFRQPQDEITTFADRFVKGVSEPRQFSADHQQIIIDHLGSTLKQLPGATLSDKLEAHYLHFRNRSHFGLRGFSFFHERPTWFPLMSASLLKAAHSISFDDRAAGRVISDVMRKINPILLDMPFDGKGIEGYNGNPIELNTDPSAWQAASKEIALRNTANRAGHQPTMVWGKWSEYVQEEAIRAHEESLQLSSKYRDIVPPGYIDRLRNEFTAKSRVSLSMASALFAVRDSIG